jgi:hypothetical protein
MPIDPDVRALLLKAADLIETKGWCQHTYAQNNHNNSVMLDDESATRWCVLGALMRCDRLYSTRVDHARDALAEYLSNTEMSIAAWNDNPLRTKAEVVAALLGAAQE